MADMIGIETDPLGSIDLARRHRFDGVDLRLDKQEQHIRDYGIERLRRAIADAGLVPGYCSILPGKISCDENTWRNGIERVPALARLAEQLGYTRTAAVVLPFDDELPFDAFFDLHVRRINEAAPVLADHGISLALEYVSPVTRRVGHKHPFIHDLAGLRKLCRATDHTNVGLLLDSFHWHCAGETAQDIEALSEDEVVVVHVNDLIARRPIEEQVVTERALPCETGLIDLAGFMGALDKIGYGGPITSEPTNPKWAATDPEMAIAELSRSMNRLMALVAV
ncbi:MAG: sugar phosphate isomerase/epimerase family protein [Phycisphaerales bacterium]